MRGGRTKITRPPVSATLRVTRITRLFHYLPLATLAHYHDHETRSTLCGALSLSSKAVSLLPTLAFNRSGLDWLCRGWDAMAGRDAT